MAKKSSLVDKALEVSRKNRVPKKPVKTKGKKTVPAVLDWGTGIPEDKLAYLNDDEMALVQAKRGFKGKRSVDGVPAFPDPGDTAAGAKSSGPDRGPTGGPSRTSPSSGAGSGGLGGGGKGTTSGSPGGSPGAGGAKSSPSGGQSSPSGGAGGQKATPSGGPGGGSLSAPARTAPSSAPSSPAGFGPRQSGTPVSTAPSTQSWQGAMDRIAKGSSVVGNPTGQKPFTDRVPQAAPKAVSYSQTPTVGPNRGLGAAPAAPSRFSSLDNSLTAGANSPFADPSVVSYDAERERDRAISSARSAAQSGILGPSVPAGTAVQKDPYFGSEQIANRYSGSMPSIGVNTAAYSTPIGPTQSQQLAADAMTNIFNKTPEVQTTPQRNGRGPMVNVGRWGTAPQAPGDYSAYRQAQAERDFANSIGESVYGGPPATAPSGMGPSTQTASVAAPTSYGPTVGTVGDPYNQRYAKAASVMGGIHPVGASPNVQPASAPPPSYSGNVFNKSPTQQAEDIRRAVALAQGAAPSTSQNQSDINVPGYPGARADISPSQGDYSPSQAPAYDVSPSQQSGLTSAQRDAYLGSLGNSKTGQVPVSQNGGQPQGSPVTPAAPMTTLAPMPDWVDYSYLYNDYPGLALGNTPNIGAFNQYNATFKRGGRVGDSIEAALRLALQGIVSRNKTS